MTTRARAQNLIEFTSFEHDRPRAPASFGLQYAQLLEAALDGNMALIRKLSTEFLRTCSVDESRDLERHISGLIKRASKAVPQQVTDRIPVDLKSRSPLIEEQSYPSEPLLVDETVFPVLNRFVAEALHADALHEAGLGSRFNLLLSGPPGTGKTFIAAHLAAKLNMRFNVVRLDSVVSSLLGETAKNIRAIFEHTSSSGRFLFIDEIDAVAKRRDDERDLGELKRVVNALIQGIDSLDGKTILVAATNHPHLLDPAIWRRFPYNIDVGLPDLKLRSSLWELYLFQRRPHPASFILAKISAGLSCSDIKELSFSVRRAALISGDGELLIDSLAYAIIRSAAGKIVMPHCTRLDRAGRSALEGDLIKTGQLTHEEVGTLLGKSRQAVGAKLRRKTAGEGATSLMSESSGGPTADHNEPCAETLDEAKHGRRDGQGKGRKKS